MATQRIQKLLAAAGYGSRRACEQLVSEGCVRVNGRAARQLPLLVDPARDRVTVNGRIVRSEPLVYYLLNKPKGVLCTNRDPAGRRRAVDLMDGVRERVFPVGRLDADSTGLLIMTNDGALAQKLTHPRFAAPKTYRVEVAGCPTAATLDRLRKGVWLSDGRSAPAAVRIVHRQRLKAILEVTLREGRNREIRRVLAKTGHNVRRLTRIRMGRLSIAKLSLGAHRRLTPAEVTYLRSLAGAPADPRSRPRRARPTAGRKPLTRSRSHRSTGAAGPRSGRAKQRGVPSKTTRNRRFSRRP